MGRAYPYYRLYPSRHAIPHPQPPLTIDCSIVYSSGELSKAQAHAGVPEHRQKHSPPTSTPGTYSHQIGEIEPPSIDQPHANYSTFNVAHRGGSLMLRMRTALAASLPNKDYMKTATLAWVTGPVPKPSS